jgi:sortase A
MHMEKHRTTEAVSKQKAPRDDTKRSVSWTRRVLANLLLVIGLGLLAIYGLARIHGALSSRAAIEQFEQQKRVNPTSTPAERAAEPRAAEPKAAPPDFMSWSEKRVEAYKESLTQNSAAPSAILRIPAIRLEAPVLEGTDDVTLNRGIGRIAGTAQIGQDGNIGLAGHRDGFFRGLKDVKVGDELQLEGRDSTDTYVVDQIQIVKPTDVQVLQPRSRPSLTLVTCYPFYYIGSAPERYIVHASRIDFAKQQHTQTEQGS